MLIFQIPLAIVIIIYACYEGNRATIAYEIAHKQQRDHEFVLERTGCQDISIHSVKHNGRIMVCEAVRLAKSRNLYGYSFDIWWQSGWWSDIHGKVTDSPLIFTVVLVAIIVSFVGFGTNAVVQDRMTTKMINQYQRQQQQQQQQPVVVPVIDSREYHHREHLRLPSTTSYKEKRAFVPSYLARKTID